MDRQNGGTPRRLPALLAALIALGGLTLAPPTVVGRHAAADHFRVGDWEIQRVPWEKRHLNGGPVMGARISGPQDASGVPLRALGPGRTYVYNPTVLAQQGMKRLDSWRRTGKGVHLRRARALARALEREKLVRQKRRWQPHRYPRPHEGVDAPWVNANSHGLTLSFLSRFHELRGGPASLAAAHTLLPAFARRPRHHRWFTLVDRKRLVWFEHWPGGRQKHVLNAHINALLGLHDYWMVTGSERAATYIRAGLTTVRRSLHRFRRPGRLSRYGLSRAAHSLHYHRTHIRQLRVLARVSGDRWFRRQARLFVEDERAWLRRAGSGGSS